MSLPKKDIIATALVAAAAAAYLLLQADAALPGMDGTRATGLVVMALGFAASATAVVPSFDQLMHSNKGYLVGTSLLGLVAFVAGIVMLASASDAALTVVIAAMLVLWAISTTHHVLLAGTGSDARGGLTPSASRAHQPSTR